jgi:hypothetical protein
MYMRSIMYMKTNAGTQCPQTSMWKAMGGQPQWPNWCRPATFWFLEAEAAPSKLGTEQFSLSPT